MNKRILDGGALWKSDKIARIQPEWMRAEYANWIPLALANGSFEADTRRIWATVYSYNRPDISFEDVEEVEREFCRVGLLFLFFDKETGKLWGYFTGIEKQGRLPAKSRLDKKHEPIGPTPPADGLRAYVELTRSKALEKSVVSQWLANGCLGFGFGLGIGSGSGEESSASRSPAPAAPGARPSYRLNTLEQETKATGFEVFWEKWPRREAKAAARRAWAKIPIAEYVALMAGLEMWRKSEQWTRGVIPHPATWLNGRRWEDEVETLAPSNSAKEGSRADAITARNIAGNGLPN